MINSASITVFHLVAALAFAFFIFRHGGRKGAFFPLALSFCTISSVAVVSLISGVPLIPLFKLQLNDELLLSAFLGLGEGLLLAGLALLTMRAPK